jgi:Rha family phage regulatory protein
MSEAATRVICPIVEFVNDQLVTTSLNIAEVFGKDHHNVMKTIRALEAPDEFNEVNFNAVEYVDAKGEKRPMYRITFDGFILLVMGFTGRKAMQYKLAYIEAFNRMKTALAEQASRALPGPDHPAAVTPELMARVRKSHRGIKVSLRVRLLEIVCRMHQLDDESPKTKAVIYADYADLCEAMRDGAVADPAESSAFAPSVVAFIEAECVIDADSTVSKNDLYAAYTRFAESLGETPAGRERFFKVLRGSVPVSDYKARGPEGRINSLRGIGLAAWDTVVDAKGGPVQ